MGVGYQALQTNYMSLENLLQKDGKIAFIARE
jgi:hypothetical protein